MGLQFRKRKVTLGYKEDKPEVYKIAQITYPAVSYDQLVKECANSCGVNSNQTKAVIDALVNRISMYMELGHGVQVGELGSFKPVFTSIVTQTAEDANANTITGKKVRFFPGAAFRDVIKDMSIVAAGESYDAQ
ncbi:MAG: HU family DNA-binding protein [Prevotellaceae bacterium]|nr:HU family DNA-binding protein [Candidatus Minthosoma caballi]